MVYIIGISERYIEISFSLNLDSFLWVKASQ